MVYGAILPLIVAVAVTGMMTGCSKTVTSSGSSGGLSSMMPWSKPSPESQGISKYTYEQQQRSVVSPALGLEDKSQPGMMAKVAAAFSPAAVGKKVSAAFQRDDVASADGAEKSKWEPGKKHQTTPEFYVSVARLAERAGNTPGATEQYEKALKVDPNHLDALLGYARMLDRQGQLTKATQLYVRATKAHPKGASAFNDLGLCYARQAMFNESAAALSEAVELHPDRDLYRNNIATVLVELGRIDEAISHLSAVQGEPIAHYNVGVLLNNHGDTPRAAEQFALAVQKNPNFVEARRWLDDLNSQSLASAPAARSPAASPVSLKRPAQGLDNAAPGLRSAHDAPSSPPTTARSPVALPERRPAARPPQSPPATQQAGPPRKSLPAESVPAWSLKSDSVDGPAIPPTPEQVRQESTVDRGSANVDTPAAIRSLPSSGSAYYPSSRY